MTTNTYQALCDSVGAKITKGCCTCDFDCSYWMTSYFMNCEPCKRHYTESVYPPQSAEQRERLEELILNLGRLSCHKNDIYYICILSRANNANNGMAGTRAEALYALTHKLFKEGVLSKEEVKDCLIGK